MDLPRRYKRVKIVNRSADPDWRVLAIQLRPDVYAYFNAFAEAGGLTKSELGRDIINAWVKAREGT